MVESQSAPLFSIVMSNYNCQQYVGQAIQSVLDQTLADWELLVVDDSSSDGSSAVIDALACDNNRIRLFVKPENTGAALTRNLAIETARGRYITFLDSDDLWHERKLERQLAFFRQTQAPLVYSAYEKIDAQGRRMERLINVPDRIDYQGLLRSTVIATLTAAYDTHKVGRVFMPDIRKRQDYALWLKILRHGGVARGLNEPLAYLRKRPGSLSSNKLSAAWYTWQVYRQIEDLPLATSLDCFSHYAVNALRKTFI